MKTLFLSLLLLLGLKTVTSQTPGNALHFDGANDYVTAALPTVFSNINGNDITIEAWVKPQGSSFSRVLFAQFGTSAFMSVSLSTTNQIYFYINNTVGVATTSTLPLNQWTHIACTWQGGSQQTEVYFNGVLQTTSSGGSSSTGVNNVMTIGSRTDGFQYFNGELDELRIWSERRSNCEISASMHSEYTVPQTNLVAYYNFNQGVPGGSNTGITNLPDFSTSYNGTLLNFGLSGTTSNWVASGAIINQLNQSGGVITSTDVQSSCGPYTWVDGITYSTNNSTATYSVPGGASNGCDSIVTLDLTILSNSTGTDVQTVCDSLVWLDGNTYMTDNSTAVYTYVGGAANGCDSIVTLNLTVNHSTYDTLIETALDLYTAPSGATYSASGVFLDTIMNAAGCDSVLTIDLTVNYTSVDELVKNQLVISPNPASHFIQIVGWEKIHDFEALEIRTIEGALVYSTASKQEKIDVTAYPTGMYVFHIIHGNGTEMHRFIKE